ncbi:MAG: glycerol-3-phosphate 1-O-acyltransferase PlsY [Planctomycetes bacterium]|nr:glycerol-3-phosphate 1-O-acyltransferase PlsY [Planctomycetota bacterium]
MNAWLSILVAYAAGCVSFALIVARAHRVDIRSLGSGNPGATNVGRVLGRGWGALVLLLDVAKGLVPALLLSAPAADLGLSGAPSWVVDAEGRSLVAAAAVLGHVWPVTERFRGGKGVATYLGAVIGLDPLLGLAGIVVHLVVKKGLRVVSLASVCLAWAVPVTQLVLRETSPERLHLRDGTLVLALLAAVITVRHRSNFARLRAGTESRYDEHVPPPGTTHHERT